MKVSSTIQVRYWLLTGSNMAQARSEMLKTQPDVVLDGPTGCGYDGFDCTFYQALQRWDQDYPQPTVLGGQGEAS